MFNLFLEGEGGGGLGLMIPLIVIIVGMLIWSSISNKKKRKEAQNMLDTLKKGDRVKTIGGICGFVVEIYDAENTFVLETGTAENKSYIKFDKAAIYQTAPKEGYANPKPKTEEVKEEDKPVEKKEVETPAKKNGKKAKKEVVVETKEEVKEETTVETTETADKE
jgi:preprotein translocase subunit YajC